MPQPRSDSVWAWAVKPGDYVLTRDRATGTPRLSLVDRIERSRDTSHREWFRLWLSPDDAALIDLRSDDTIARIS